MEDSEFKLTRSKASGNKYPRNQDDRINSPFMGDEGRLEDFYQPEGRFGEPGGNRYGNDVGGGLNRSGDRLGETGTSRFADPDPNRFGETGMSKFGETAMSRFGETGMNRFVDTKFGRNTGFTEQEPAFRTDMHAEIHFIGELLGGKDFDCKEGLFCEMLLSVGDGWKINGAAEPYRTQVCYAQNDEMFVWAHPIDLHFSVSDPTGWPRAIFRVWRLDKGNKIDIFSYGVAQFPRTSGHHKIKCDTWTPIGSWKTGSLDFFLGINPRLQSMDIINDFLEKRTLLNSNSSGTVILELDVIMKNFNKFPI